MITHTHPLPNYTFHQALCCPLYFACIIYLLFMLVPPSLYSGCSLPVADFVMVGSWCWGVSTLGSAVDSMDSLICFNLPLFGVWAHIIIMHAVNDCRMMAIFTQPMEPCRSNGRPQNGTHNTGNFIVILEKIHCGTWIQRGKVRIIWRHDFF